MISSEDKAKFARFIQIRRFLETDEVVYPLALICNQLVQMEIG